jgi:hypothetical protein
MSESKILHDVLLNFTKKTNSLSRIFRNNVGTAWAGKFIKTMNGVTTLKHARAIRFGLAKGSSDAIGWHTIKITPDMIGKNVAVFTAVETKTRTGRTTLEQNNFLLTVKEAGGISGVVKSLDDLDSLVESYDFQ